MNLVAYLRRIGLESTFLQSGQQHPGPPGNNLLPSSLPPPDVNLLSTIMTAHSRSICFENCNVAMGKTISLKPENIEQKLVHENRGGYCFEQNSLLQMALQELGFQVTPMLCRVLWNTPKEDYSRPPVNGFTHMVLKVRVVADSKHSDQQQDASNDKDGPYYLADVSFGHINSLSPIQLGHPEPQTLPEGQFRIVDGRPGYKALQVYMSTKDPENNPESNDEDGDHWWRSLYTWRQNEEAAAQIDIDISNWYSCTHPESLFTTSLYLSIAKQAAAEEGAPTDERHRIFNDSYAIRKNGYGNQHVVEKYKIHDKAQLLHLLDSVFGLRFPPDVEGLDRYL